MNAGLTIVCTTFEDEGRARKVVRQLVEDGLVACGQVEASPVHSVYRWKGAVESAEEYRVMLKIPPTGVERLRVRLHELHPYEVPEFVVLEATASDAYARWVGESCP